VRLRQPSAKDTIARIYRCQCADSFALAVDVEQRAMVAEGWRTETEPQIVHERGARNLRLLAARVATHCQSLARAAGTDGGAGAAAAAAVGGRLRLPPELPGVRCGTAAQNTRVAGVYTDQLATNRFSNPMLDHVREEAHGFATLDRWVL
jgi:hypothetical protein